MQPLPWGGGRHGSDKQSANYRRSRSAALGDEAGYRAQRALYTRGTQALRSIVGLCRLAAKHHARDLDAACAKALDAAAGDHAPGQLQIPLREADPIIRPLDAYVDFIRSQTPGGDTRFPPGTKTKNSTADRTRSTSENFSRSTRLPDGDR